MRVLLLGDSLFQMYDWGSRFPHTTLLNRGVAGDTVQDLLARIDVELLRLPAADLLFVMIGTNNLLQDDYGFLGDFGRLLDRIVSHDPLSRLAVFSLLPFRLPWLAGNAVSRINTLLREETVGRESDFIDLHGPFCAACRKKQPCFLADGVHLTPWGYTVWSGIMEEYLRLHAP